MLVYSLRTYVIIEFTRYNRTVRTVSIRTFRRTAVAPITKTSYGHVEIRDGSRLNKEHLQTNYLIVQENSEIFYVRSTVSLRLQCLNAIFLIYRVNTSWTHTP